MNYAHVEAAKSIRIVAEKTHKIRKIEEFINYLNGLNNFNIYDTIQMKD